jgi:hypothetical protein
MGNLTGSTPGAAGADGRKSLKERAVGELEKFVVIAVYLFILLGVFSLHRQLLQGRGISLWQQGFAIVNALVLAKIVLIGDALNLGKSVEGRPLAWSVLRKSLILAVLLVAFHIFEEAARAWLHGRPLSSAVLDFGGSLAGVAAYGAIFFVTLIPFSAFQEVDRALGDDFLWRLFFRPRVKADRAGEP